MSIKAKIEAIIYAAEEPVTLEQIFALIKEEARLELAQLRRQKEDAPEPAEEPVIPVEQAAEVQTSEAPEVAEPTVSETSEQQSQEQDSAEAAQPEAPPEEASPAETPAPESQEPETEQQPALHPITDLEVKSFLRASIEELAADYSAPERGIEVRQIAGGYRMATKPEQHDVVRSFAKSLKPPIRLSLQALETLAVIAYKQPITAPEISEVRGVDAGGVLGTLLARKLITTAGRKQVIGRPMLYKTTKEFLLRFGLKDIGELPSMEEFEKLAAESLGADLFTSTQSSSEQQQGEAQEPASAEGESAAQAESASSAEEPSATLESPAETETAESGSSAPSAEGGTEADDASAAEQAAAVEDSQPVQEDTPVTGGNSADQSVSAEEPVAQEGSQS